MVQVTVPWALEGEEREGIGIVKSWVGDAIVYVFELKERVMVHRRQLEM